MSEEYDVPTQPIRLIRGDEVGEATKDCGTCNGTGRVPGDTSLRPYDPSATAPCKNCDGTGRVAK